MVFLTSSPENLCMLFSRPVKIDCITWRLGRSRSRCFWRGHVVFAVLCLGLWSPRIVNCWLKLEYPTFQNTEANIFALVVFARSLGIELDGIIWKKGTSFDWCTNVVWGVWSMALRENRIFSCFGEIVVDRIWWLYVKTKRFCTCCFREITVNRIRWDQCSFCFRENVVNRIWWHLLKQRFFPCTFCEIFIDIIQCCFHAIIVDGIWRHYVRTKKILCLLLRPLKLIVINKSRFLMSLFFLPH